MFLVWSDSNASCRIICRCTNHNAADAVAKALHGIVSLPDHSYRSN